jgi:sporulation protein YlmC with PRC-barrel domain
MPTSRSTKTGLALSFMALLGAVPAAAEEAATDALAATPEVDVAPAAAELPSTTGAVSVMSLLELDVVSADDEGLGDVYDLVADPEDGLLKFLVIQRGGEILGIDIGVGAERVAIPWHRVEMQEAPRRLIVDFTAKEIEALPDWEGARTEGGLVGAAPVDEPKGVN